MAAEIYVEGINLGYSEKPYDFENEKGERIAGTSRLLKVLVDTEVVTVKVPEDFTQVAKALPLKQQVGLRLSIPSTVRPTLIDTAA